VLRLLRGDLDTLSRELGITAARLSQWRDDALVAGEVGLKSRQPDSRDAEIARLKEEFGELTIDLQVSREVSRLQQEAPHPLAWWKSK
jgi:hypothetical protein